MDLQQLRYFLIVADHLNLSHAAESIGISQPALSKAMARLQARTGVRLYARNGRGIALTDAGHALRHRAAEILDRVEAAELVMSDMRAGVGGHVRLGAGPSFLAGSVPAALSSLQAEDPSLRFTLREGTTQELYDWVKTREIDCALLGWIRSPEAPTRGDAALAFSRLLVDDLVIVTRADHPLQLSPPRRFADLSAYDWVLPRMSTRLHGELDRIYRAARADPPVARVQTSSLFATCAILRRSDLMTLLARSALSDPEMAGLRPLEQGWLTLQREAFLVTQRDLPLPQATGTLIRAIRQRLADPAGGA
ncbi:LysR family transcriptional regulator [Pseudodonghicola flavimaris]|uniref:LysR family transcriptional regulator n=1 Tax=Pseudodonghicola flavimaris TaxID=3050036 RepID=A0ABT7F1A9_9RHOB|nr:LysR family transcriptional regulator [Pseudodonghicola flavimaris]MDK3018383.1 LysR family transcriptional regulator [Pseudodonghicola flavimaris]